MSSMLGTLAVRLRADTAEFTKELKVAQSKLQGVADTATKVATVAGVAFGGMALLGAKFVKVASDMDENMNVVRTSFGKMTPEVIKWARTSASEMGRSEFQMREFAGTTQALLSPMMGSAKAAAAMSMQVAQLAVDIGSFNNVADADALIAIKAGLIGSSEPMIKFGVDVRESALAAFALSQGITTSVKSMTGAQKVALRYASIMGQTTLQQGDAAKTSEGFANVMKAIEGLMTDVAGEIGAAMLPMVTAMAAGIRDLLGWFKGLSPEVKVFAGRALVVATALVGMVAGLAAVAAILPSIIAGFSTVLTVFAAVAPVVAGIGVAIAVAGVLMVGYKDISKTTTSDVALMWKQLGNDINESMGTTSEEVSSTWGDIVDFAEDSLKQWSFISDEIGRLWDDAMTAIGKTALGKLAGDIVDFAEDSLKQWSFISDEIVAFFQTAVTDITALWDWVANSYFGQIAGTIISVFVSIWAGILRVFIWPFKQAFAAIAETIDYWGKKLGLITEETTKAGGALQSFFGISDEDVAAQAAGGGGGPSGKPKQTAATVAAVGNLKALLAASGTAITEATEELATSIITAEEQFQNQLTATDIDIEEDIKETVKTIGGSLSAAGQTLADAIITGAGTLGDVVEGAKAGMETGGPWGAVIGAVTALLQKTEFFSGLIDTVNEFMDFVVGIFDRYLEALSPMLRSLTDIMMSTTDLVLTLTGLDLLFSALGSVTKLVMKPLEMVAAFFGPLAALFSLLGNKFMMVIMSMAGFNEALSWLGEATNWIATVMANIIQGFVGVWNKMIDWFADLAAHLSDDLADSIRKAKISMREAAAAAGYTTMGGVVGGGDLGTGGLADSFGALGDTVDALNQSLTNVPEGFKVQAARYQAINVGEEIGETVGGIQMGEQLTINLTVQNTEEAAQTMIDALEELAFARSGSRVGGLAWGTDTGGA